MKPAYKNQSNIHQRIHFERHKCLAIGCSLGGKAALETIFSRLRTDLNFPIVICQHVHPELNRNFKTFKKTHTISDAKNNERPLNSHVYFAPPNRHLEFNPDGTFKLNEDPPLHFARPSIDKLFFSAAQLFNSNLIGVLLTGSNADGADGMKQINNRGGITIVQDPSYSEYPKMPLSALDKFEPEYILKLSEITDLINETI